MRARVEAVGRVDLTKSQAQVLLRSKSVHIFCITFFLMTATRYSASDWKTEQGLLAIGFGSVPAIFVIPGVIEAVGSANLEGASAARTALRAATVFGKWLLGFIVMFAFFGFALSGTAMKAGS